MALGRIRSIKPEFFIDEKLGSVGPYERLAYIGLWLYADKHGTLKDVPKELKLLILPYDNVDMHRILEHLAATGVIVRYESDGIKCIYIAKFRQHQQIRENEIDFNLPKPPNYENFPKTSGNSGKGPSGEERRGEEGNMELERKGREGRARRTRPVASPLKAAPASLESFLKELQAKPAYQTIDVRHVYAKMAIWCEVKGKQPTTNRLISWLNREDRPLVGPVGECPKNRDVAAIAKKLEANRVAKSKSQTVGSSEKAE